jgi:hypothetical protein
MIPLAVTALEAMRAMPVKSWMIIGTVILIIVIAFVVIPKIFKMNKIILGVIILVAGSIMFFSWVKQRNEPKILTPFIDMLAPFFDSDVHYKKNDKKMPK